MKLADPVVKVEYLTIQPFLPQKMKVNHAVPSDVGERKNEIEQQQRNKGEAKGKQNMEMI